MITKLAITLTSASIAILSASCSTQMKAPGDTAVHDRTVEHDKEPGNILADRRIEAVGD